MIITQSIVAVASYFYDHCKADTLLLPNPSIIHKTRFKNANLLLTESSSYLKLLTHVDIILQDFSFKQLVKVQLDPIPTTEAKQRCHLLAVSNKYGLAFVGCANGTVSFHPLSIGLFLAIRILRILPASVAVKFNACECHQLAFTHEPEPSEFTISHQPNS